MHGRPSVRPSVFIHIANQSVSKLASKVARNSSSVVAHLVGIPKHNMDIT